MKTQKEFLEKLQEAANIIHKKSIQPKANWMIVSEEIAEMIENLDIRVLRRKKLEQINKKASE